MKNETKSIKFEIKADHEDDDFMIFTGIASPFNNKPDLGGDIVEKGAFKTSLKQKGNTRVLLFHHSTFEPIGTVKLKETDEGLMITEGKIDKRITRGGDVARLISMGAIKGLSIGFRTMTEKIVKGIRHLIEIKLFEMSIVPFPMNEGAMITSAKAELANISFDDTLSSLIERVDEAKESSFDLMNEAVKKLNSVLMNSFDESGKPLDDSSLSDHGENKGDDNSDESEPPSSEEKEDLEAEEIKNELIDFFKGLGK